MPLAEELPNVVKQPAVPIRDLVSSEWNALFGKLAGFANLEPGWDSYNAPAPTTAILTAAKGFLQFLQSNDDLPSKLTPSVVGGVAFAFRNGERVVYVEFRNTGNAHAAFTDSQLEPEVIKVRQDSTGYTELMTRVGSYLHEQTARCHEDQ